MKSVALTMAAIVLACSIPGALKAAKAKDPGALCENYINKNLDPPPTEYDAPLVTFDDTEGIYFVTSNFKVEQREMMYLCGVRSGQVLGVVVDSQSAALRVTPELIHKWMGTQVENSRELQKTVREFKTDSVERGNQLKTDMARWHASSYVPATRNFGAAVASFNAAYQQYTKTYSPSYQAQKQLRKTCEGLRSAVHSVTASGTLDTIPDAPTRQSLERFYATVLDVHDACLKNQTFALDDLLKREIPAKYQALSTRFATFGLRP